MKYLNEWFGIDKMTIYAKTAFFIALLGFIPVLLVDSQFNGLYVGAYY